MKLIMGGQGTGKTKQLIQLSLETGAPIVCANAAEEEAIVGKSLNHFGKGCTVCLPEEAKDFETVLVRDAELLLNKLLDTTVIGMTVTTD